MEKVLLNIKKEGLFLILSILPLGFQKSKNISDSYIKTCEELKGTKGKLEARESLDELFHKKIERFEKFHKGIRVRRKVLILSLLIIILAFYSTITSQIKGSQYENLFPNNKMFFVFSYTCYLLLIAFILSTLLYSRKLLVVAKVKYTKLLVNYRIPKIIGNSATSNKSPITEITKDFINNTSSNTVPKDQIDKEDSNYLTSQVAEPGDYGSSMYILIKLGVIVEERTVNVLVDKGILHIKFKKKNIDSRKDGTEYQKKLISGKEFLEKKIKKITNEMSNAEYSDVKNWYDLDFKSFEGNCLVRINPSLFMSILSKFNERYFRMNDEVFFAFSKSTFRFQKDPHKTINTISEFKINLKNIKYD